MNTKTLNNGTVIPQIGLGVFRATNEETEHAVQWAIEAGYRHIDTAMVYKNEEAVGSGIRKSGIPRDQIFLTTKLWNEDIRKHRAAEAFEESLYRLQTDYVDLYLIHWPAEGFLDAWLELEKLYQSGKIRAIGVSNFNPHHLEELAAVAAVKPAVNQIESHPYFCNQEVIDYCMENGIQPAVWSPLGGKDAAPIQDETIGAIAKAHGRTPAQVIIRWHLQRGVVVLPKSVHRERIISNIDVFSFTLSSEEMSRIDALNRNVRVGSNPETFTF